MHIPFQPSPAAFPWKEWLKTFVLLGLGLYMAVLIITGSINNYMNQRFQWLVALAAVLFLLLGMWSLYRLWCLKPQQHVLDDNLNISHEGHDHTRLSWGTLFVAMIPLAFAVLLPSRPLGAEAITGGLSLNTVGVADASSASRAPIDRNILDWLREFNRVGIPATFNGAEADLTGFIYREPFMAEDQFMVARFTVSCCVADAFAIGIPVQAADASQYPTGEWVRVRGTFTAGRFGEDQMPILRPTSIEKTTIPASPYLYP